MKEVMRPNQVSEKLNVRIASVTDMEVLSVYTHTIVQWERLLMKLFGGVFSTWHVPIELKYSELMNALQEKYYVDNGNIIFNEKADRDDTNLINENRSETFMILKDHFAIRFNGDEYLIYYNSRISREEVRELASFVEKFQQEKEKKKKFYMLATSRNELITQGFSIRECDVDVFSNYNDDFIEVHEEIVTALESQKKNGIILLHGKWGTGKTHYIRHLVSVINKKFIYMPLHLVNSISSPDFIPFMMSQPNSVLILEDCEKFLIKRDQGNKNSEALSTLLNLGDGFLSDALSMNVICSFNTNLKNVDDALLRKGRLIARYEFGELETEKAQLLASNLGKDISIKSPTLLSAIYNAEARSYEEEKRAIGFGV